MYDFEYARLNSIARKILRLFHWFKKHGMRIFMRQSEIAGRVGCCRATVNRWINRLCERGFLRRDKRTPRFWLYVLVTASVTAGVTSPRVSPLTEQFERFEPARRFAKTSPEGAFGHVLTLSGKLAGLAMIQRHAATRANRPPFRAGLLPAKRCWRLP